MMTSPMEYNIGPSNFEWYYDEDRDVVVVTTTTTAYIVLYLGHLNAAIAPHAPAPTILPEFLQPPLTMLEYEPMSPDLSPLEHVAPELPIVEFSFSNSPVPIPEPLSTLDSIKLDPSETTSTATSRVSRRALRPLWIRTPIILLDMVVMDVVSEFHT